MEERNREGLNEAEFLANYRVDNYKRPSVTVDTLIFTIDMNAMERPKLEVLLIRRNNHPGISDWAIAGGVVKIDESVDEAAARELQEETGLSDIYLEQLYTWGAVNRDPRMRVISVSYMALIPKEKLKPSAGDDAGEVGWFEVSYDNRKLFLYGKDGIVLEEENLAFDHAKIITLAIQRMRNKIDYTSLAFNLLPKKFTLGELQLVYEAILGTNLHKSNFRRRVSKRVLATNEICTGKRGKPSIYYIRKEDVE